MNGQDFQRQVHEEYQQINNKWMRIHFRLLFYCTLVSGTVESLMFFFILKIGTLNCTVDEYWWKYVIIPFFLSSCVVLAGYTVLKREKVSMAAKQYTISFLFVVLAFILELMHSGFVATLAVAIFPILMTIMYENRRLTTIIAVCTGAMQAVSGYYVFWDPDKVVNSAYLVNLMILLVATFCAWLTCSFMISFMKMKREIILSNDIERFRLQTEIHIDGLTGVGNKMALTNRLDALAADFADVTYLAMLDLDHFKKINDMYGHIFGDEVLRCLGNALRNIENGAESYRYGGDEFCVLFTITSWMDVLAELENVQAYLKDHLKVPDDRSIVSISVGIAGYSKGKTVTELLRQADEALYESKRNPTNRITVYKEGTKVFESHKSAQ